MHSFRLRDVSGAEARLAARSFVAFARCGALLMVAALIAVCARGVEKRVEPATARVQVAHVIENWPEPTLHTRMPRHVAGEEGARVRVKLRAPESDGEIAVLMALPAVPVRQADNYPVKWRPALAGAGHLPRPYDPQGPPHPFV